MECVKSIGHGLFAVIKVIFSNRNDLELIMNYIYAVGLYGGMFRIFI